MIRFILKHVYFDGETPAQERMYTIDTQNKELEEQLNRGGCGGTNGSYEYTKLIGAEVVKDDERTS